MSTAFDDLMYRAGLTADGSFGDMDSYDQEAIMRFAELIVKETLQVARAGMEFGVSMDEAVYTYFGLKNETF